MVSEARSAALELPAWARITGHEVVDERQERTPDGVRYVVRLRRGSISRVLGESVSAGHTIPALPGGGFPTGEARRVAERPPAEAVRTDGLIPLGAHPEQGSARYDWPLTRRDELWSDKLASLTDRAARSQWSATTDIPWDAGRTLQTRRRARRLSGDDLHRPERVRRLLRPGPLSAAGQSGVRRGADVACEPRPRRGTPRRGLHEAGARWVAIAPTRWRRPSSRCTHCSRSSDFTAAALLLNVLGEGTFLDLLNFVAVHAPDAATATAARLAHQDERRHVQFGISAHPATTRARPGRAERARRSGRETRGEARLPRRSQSHRHGIARRDDRQVSPTSGHRRGRRPRSEADAAACTSTASAGSKPRASTRTARNISPSCTRPT